jgi:hypothetical protein
MIPTIETKALICTLELIIKGTRILLSMSCTIILTIKIPIIDISGLLSKMLYNRQNTSNYSDVRLNLKFSYYSQQDKNILFQENKILLLKLKQISFLSEDQRYSFAQMLFYLT